MRLRNLVRGLLVLVLAAGGLAAPAAGAAPVLAINSADDVVNPPELGLMEKLMPRVRNGRYVLIPTSEETRGHGTHSLPAVWGSHLEAFLKALAPTDH